MVKYALLPSHLLLNADIPLAVLGGDHVGDGFYCLLSPQEHQEIVSSSVLEPIVYIIWNIVNHLS
jgi:hypothetical protein